MSTALLAGSDTNSRLAMGLARSSVASLGPLTVVGALNAPVVGSILKDEISLRPARKSTSALEAGPPSGVQAGVVDPPLPPLPVPALPPAAPPLCPPTPPLLARP